MSRRMLAKKERRLQVSLDEIRSHDRALADGLLNSPFEYLEDLDKALKQTATVLAAGSQRITDDMVGYQDYIARWRANLT